MSHRLGQFSWSVNSLLDKMSNVPSSDWTAAQVQSRMETYIVDNPGPSLATAFFVGVAVAWLIKRR